MQKNYGATTEEWDRAAALFGVANLIPIAPTGEPSPASSLQQGSVGKVPSVYNSAGNVVGFKDWPSHEATPADIEKWKRRGYNIGLILGRDCGDGTAFCAVDVDTVVSDYQDTVYDLLAEITGLCLPYRGRSNSERRAYIVRAPVMPKHALILPEENGKAAAIELLAKGQQVVIHGQHPSKGRYQWIGNPMIGMPRELRIEDIPVLTSESFAELWAAIGKTLPVVDSTIARVGRRRDLSSIDASATDDVADYLDANGWTISVSADGSRNLLPFRDESEYSNGCNETSIKYFPAGTGGFQQGHFVSLHATDTGLTDADWLDGYGVRDNDFDVLPPDVSEPAPLPSFVRNPKTGQIKATIDNAAKAVMRPDFCGLQIKFDQFRDEIMFASPGSDQWQSFADADYSRLRITLERRSFEAVGKELIRDVVMLAADEQPFDSAITWLNSLEWDGVPRINTFYHTHFGTEDNAYSRAVSLYMWTAMAGRVLTPGCKADMVPILVGPQGIKKSSGVAALAPDPAFFTEVSFAEKDDDLARKMRGRLVAEIGELRGLHTKELESIKAFITRTHENWIPKYREFATQFPRRLVFIGTSNPDEFLADTTGNRRWLPVRVVSEVQVDAIKADRLQLWAEARDTFKRLGGVQFQAAEQLAAIEHEQYMIKDAWLETVERWLDEPDLMTEETPRTREFLRATDVLRDALNLDPKQISRREQMRISSVLQTCGYKPSRETLKGKQQRVFVKK